MSAFTRVVYHKTGLQAADRDNAPSARALNRIEDALGADSFQVAPRTRASLPMDGNSDRHGGLRAAWACPQGVLFKISAAIQALCLSRNHLIQNVSFVGVSSQASGHFANYSLACAS
jgi:hypothetical protein